MIAYKVDTVVTCAEPVEVSHSMAVDENTETLSLTGGLLTKGLGYEISDRVRNDHLFEALYEKRLCLYTLKW